MKKPLTLALAPTLCVALLAASLSAAAISAHAACPSWPNAERFTISGEEVTDTRTGLVWKRCSEGQTLSGNSCTGTAATYTHEQTLARAQIANTANSATGWRLPHVKELASLADKGCLSPAIDSTAFPGTPSSWYWSSSPYVGNSGNAWSVNFLNGYVDSNGRGYGSQVRLVRASQ
jgi:hypothetical protein